MARAAFLLALSGLALAGCLGGDGGGGDGGAASPGTGPQAGGAEAAGVPAPAWSVGDWWNYTSEGVGAYTLVVASEGPSDYAVATDSPAVAFFDQRFDISYMGPQRKADLAGSQGDARVRFFDWPLEDGKSWTTRWDGQDVTITADVRGDGKVRLDARNATAPYAAYVYDPAARWVSLWQFYGRDGAVAFEARLARWGGGYAGSLASWQLETVFEGAGDLASVPFTGSTYSVPATVTDVYVELSIACSTGVAGVGTGPFPFTMDPQGRGAGSDVGPCPIEDAFAGSAGAPAPPAAGGDEVWGYEVNGGPGTTGTYSLAIFLRTLTVTPFPA